MNPAALTLGTLLTLTPADPSPPAAASEASSESTPAWTIAPRSSARLQDAARPFKLSGPVADGYVWKALQARAGKVLLKVYKPGAAPIPEFDPLDLDF